MKHFYLRVCPSPSRCSDEEQDIGLFDIGTQFEFGANSMENCAYLFGKSVFHFQLLTK